MPQITRYKPNRTHDRKYTREDAARVVCYALEAIEGGRNITEDPTLDGSNVNRRGGRTVASVNFGGRVAFFDRDLEEIITRVKERCGSSSSKPRGFEAAAAAQAQATSAQEDGLQNDAIGTMEQAQREIDESQITFSNILEWTAALLTFLVAVDRLSKFIPFAPLRLVLSPLPLVIRRAAGFQGAVLARKAANDRTWARLERAITLLKAA